MKQMRLFLLFVAMLAIQPAFAGTKIDAVKKVGKVSWHSAEVAMGFIFMFDHLMNFWPFQDSFRYGSKKGQIDYTNLLSQIEGWQKWQKKIMENKLQFIIEPIGVHTLLAEGFRGLNRELHLVERYTKLINRVRNRKQVRTV